MPVPATLGSLRNSLQEMEIGDYITMNAKTEYQFGTAGLTECPVLGVSYNESYTNYFWYMIKVAKGLLISDRVWLHTISWDAVNANRTIEGLFIPALNGYIRSLTGGVAYADVNGNLTMTQVDLSYGAFPSTNEFDAFIKKSNLNGKVTPDDDNVWHHKYVFTSIQETPTIGTWRNLDGNTQVVDSSWRMLRGYDLRADSKWVDLSVTTSNASGSTWGFRPVFEYKEV